VALTIAWMAKPVPELVARIFSFKVAGRRSRTAFNRKPVVGITCRIRRYRQKRRGLEIAFDFTFVQRPTRKSGVKPAGGRRWHA